VSVHLRPAMPTDALDVARVHVRSWQAGYRGLLPDAYLDGLRAEDRAARYTFGSADPDRPATIVAVEDDRIRGFATTGPARADDPDVGIVLALYVDPEAWRHGIGRVLIAGARDALVRRGYTHAMLWLLDGNDRGARFYTSDGWAFDGERRAEVVWAIAVTELRYRRTLP